MTNIFYALVFVSQPTEAHTLNSYDSATMLEILGFSRFVTIQRFI